MNMASRQAINEDDEWYLIELCMIATAIVVGVATFLNQLLLAAAAAAGAAVLAFAVRRPLPLLLVYIAAIPFENAGPLEIVGSTTKIVGLAFAAAYLLHRGRSLRLGLPGFWGWALIIWIAASPLWAVDRSSAFSLALTQVQLFAITVLVADLVRQRSETTQLIAWTYTVSATVTGAIGIVNYLVNRSALPDGRAEAFAGQGAPQLAAMLVPAFLWCAWIALRRVSLLAIVCGWISGLAIIVSGTRSAWVAVAAAFLLAFLPRLSAPRRRLLIGAILLGSVTLLVLPGVGDVLVERTATAIASGGTGRTAIWAVGLESVPDHPLMGIGFGQFPTVITPENVRSIALPVQTDVVDAPIGPHNLVVGTIVELGVVGVLLLFGFAWRLLGSAAEWDPAFAVQSIVLAFAVQSLFLGIFNLKQVWLFIGLALGLTAADRLRARSHA
jgi:O-antigen ligase